MTLPVETRPSPPPVVSDNVLVLSVYVLYALGFFTAITALIGVIIAHVKVREADPVLQSHFEFQIRTFWIGLLNLVVGVPLSLVLIGIPILVWGFVWSLVRVVKGLILVNEGRPIANPRSWMFG